LVLTAPRVTYCVLRDTKSESKGNRLEILFAVALFSAVDF
jgi:hypothetical protein